MQLPKEASSARAKQLSRTVHGTKRDAQRALAAAVAEVASGEGLLGVHHARRAPVAMARPHGRAALADDGASTDGSRPSSSRRPRRVPLRRVTTQRLDAFYASLARDRQLSPASIRHVHAVLRGTLGLAVRWGWFPVNAAASASPPKLRRHEIIPPAIHDTAGAAHRRRRAGLQLRALLRVLAATGARRGEICGLQWTDIDSEAKTVCIRRSVASVVRGTVVKDTKTHAARKIAVDAGTLEVLRHRQRVEELARACRLEFNPDGYVFTSAADGSAPLHPDTVTGGLRPAVRPSGLGGLRLHDLRHLHATQLLAAGVPVRTGERPTRARQRRDEAERIRALPRGQRPSSRRRDRRRPSGNPWHDRPAGRETGPAPRSSAGGTQSTCRIPITWCRSGTGSSK